MPQHPQASIDERTTITPALFEQVTRPTITQELFGWCLDGYHRQPDQYRRQCPGEFTRDEHTRQCTCRCHIITTPPVEESTL